MGRFEPSLTSAGRETPCRQRRHALRGETNRCWRVGLAVLMAFVVSPARGEAPPPEPAAVYQVELLGTTPPRFRVKATLPSRGAELSMALSRSGDVPEVADAGWPGLIRDLSVVDAQGQAVGVTSAGAEGWRLGREVRGALTVHYDVDLGPVARRGWPAPRETAYADDKHLVVIGRSLFLFTPEQQASEVRFVLPPGWQPALPWDTKPAAATEAVAPSTQDLTENLLAFVRGAPDVLNAGGFRLKVVAFGPWQPAREEVLRVLGATVQRLVAMVGFAGQGDYLVVLLPQAEDGGESFRASFALNTDQAPTRANVGRWGNTITHEVFHYWNGWRLRGADYASSQWFQEGFTEYAANRALVSSGVIEPREFYAKLATHVTNYRRLATPLDAPGTHKGPPLYSGGALVALIWDTTIRDQTRGARGLDDLLRALFQNTDQGARPYEWSDLQAALAGVAPRDWADFHRRFLHGTEPLPLAEALTRLGLVMSQEGEGGVRVEEDPAAPEAAAGLRRAVFGGSR